MKTSRFLIVGGIVLAVYLVYISLKGTNVQPIASVPAQTTLQSGSPANSFQQPQVASHLSVPDLTVPSFTYQQPNASGSGVPSFTPTAAEFFNNNPLPLPKIDFYGPVKSLVDAIVKSLQPPTVVTPSKSVSNTCTGGSGCGCESCVSGCATDNSRYTDGRGGCLAATPKQQLKSLMPVLSAQSARIQNSPDITQAPDVIAATKFSLDLPTQNLPDGSLPVNTSPIITPIGIKRPVAHVTFGV